MDDESRTISSLRVSSYTSRCGWPLEESNAEEAVTEINEGLGKNKKRSPLNTKWKMSSKMTN
jgi:hypothetical protein